MFALLANGLSQNCGREICRVSSSLCPFSSGAGRCSFPKSEVVKNICRVVFAINAGGGGVRHHLLVLDGQAGDHGGRGPDSAGARPLVQVPVLAGDRCVLGGVVAGGEGDVIRAAARARGVLGSVK